MHVQFMLVLPFVFKDRKYPYPMSEEKPDVILTQGIVQKALPNAIFDVLLDNGHNVISHISGKIRMNNIKILVGDKVDVELSIYCLTQGRIIYRYK